MTSRTVAIHQPNFFPWLGYFDKIRRSDDFVFLDSVQLPGGAGNWCNRVQLLIAGSPRWVTAGLDRSRHTFIRVDEARFHQRDPWRNKLIKTLESNYSRHAAYREVSAVIFPLVANDEDNLSTYNVTAITTIAEHLGLAETRFVRSSEIDEARGSSNDLLASIVTAVGGSAYLTGSGALDYLDESKFAAAGLNVVHQRFRHPHYQQRGSETFTEGLSIIDALMNLGWLGVRRLLDSNANRSSTQR